MPKIAKAVKVGSGFYGEVVNGVDNKVAVDLFELDAKTKDKDGKETKFKYQFPEFPEDTSVETLVRALTYTKSDKEKTVVSGASVLLDYTNTAIKNAARSAKLAEINGVLKMREDPEAAINAMIDAMVVGFGVKREVATANIRAMVASGQIVVPGSETSKEQPTA